MTGTIDRPALAADPAPALNPVLVEVIGSALASICEEMGEALVKASYSPNIKERRDSTTALFDAEGTTLAQAEHIPIHFGSLMGVVASVLDRYPVETLRDGDVFIGNDPHTGGGTHLPDIVLLSPIFVEGRLRAWATNLAHHADYAERTHEHIFQEGLRIPAVRLFTAGEMDEDIWHLILTNMQVPAERRADLRAQMAANRLGIQRYREICSRYGADIVEQAGRDLMDYTERKIRLGIAEIPDGTYEFDDLFDSDEFEGELPISLSLTVRGDEMFLEFQAPPQIRAGINNVWTALLATVYYAVKAVIGMEVFANAGLYRPIHVTAPRASILNCVVPAAVYGRIQLGQRVVDLILGALAQAVPARVPAASYSGCPTMCFSGVDPRTGEYYIYIESIGGGHGAGIDVDGMDGAQAHLTNTSNLPVESLEAEYPLTVVRYGLVDDSSGHGRHRGGMGIWREIRAEHDECRCETSVTRVTTSPWGLFGGTDGQRLRVQKGDGTVVTDTWTTLSTGESLACIIAGGGGYGDPHERDRAAVATDVREGRISADIARDVYGPYSA
ncbi:hydantoinase B/oxoprolinase family protein [Microbacterium tumbae]